MIRLDSVALQHGKQILFLEASVALEDGTVLATGEGTFVSLGPL